MAALFALLVVDAAARYVMGRRQSAGWWISLFVCPAWAITALVSDVPYAAYLALPWSIAALINIRQARRDQAPATPAGPVDTADDWRDGPVPSPTYTDSD